MVAQMILDHFVWVRALAPEPNMAPWSSGQDAALSRRSQGFDSPWGYQECRQQPCIGCWFFLCGGIDKTSGIRYNTNIQKKTGNESMATHLDW